MWDENYTFWLLQRPPLFLDEYVPILSEWGGSGRLGAYWREWAVIRWKHFVMVFKTPDAQESISVSLHLGFTVGGFLRFAFLGNQLIGFLHFILFNHWVAHFHISVLQFMSWQVLNDASPKGVSQHVGGGAQAVPGGGQEEGKTRCLWIPRDFSSYFEPLSAWKRPLQFCLAYPPNVLLHHRHITFILAVIKSYEDP